MNNKNDITDVESCADAFLAQGKFEEALRHYDNLVRSGGASGRVWCHVGDGFCGIGDYVQAKQAYDQALALAPDHPALHINLARALFHLGEADGAAEHLAYGVAHGREREALERLATIAPGVPAYDLGRILEARRAYGDLLAEGMGDRSLVFSPVRKSSRTVRLAYLSAHYNQPAYMGPVWGLINHHDRGRFHVTMLSDGTAAPPFAGYVSHPQDVIIPVANMDDVTLSQALEEAGIDILVDLSGYSYPKRLTLFTRRVAPCVVTWFNMYATSGMPGIDYIVGDEYVVRPDEERYYSERVLRLPQSYLTFQAWDERPEPVPPPCAAGNAFTFGSLVALYKITPPLLDAWAEILKRAPAARLLIGNARMDSPRNLAYLQHQFEMRGVPSARLEIRGSAPHEDFLRYYDAIDLALDAFPYSGGTTSMEAIWQGVPVLTQAGDRWAARTTGSILRDTHLRRFCCANVEEYIERAVTIAEDPAAPEWLRTLRTEMRTRLRDSRALDCAALARHMEGLYLTMLEAPYSSL